MLFTSESGIFTGGGSATQVFNKQDKRKNWGFNTRVDIDPKEHIDFLNSASKDGVPESRTVGEEDIHGLAYTVSEMNQEAAFQKRYLGLLQQQMKVKAGQINTEIDFQVNAVRTAAGVAAKQKQAVTSLAGIAFDARQKEEAFQGTIAVYRRAIRSTNRIF